MSMVRRFNAAQGVTWPTGLLALVGKDGAEEAASSTAPLEETAPAPEDTPTEEQDLPTSDWTAMELNQFAEENDIDLDLSLRKAEKLEVILEWLNEGGR